MAAPTLKIADCSWEVTYTETGIIPILNYLVGVVVAQVGHSRVYNRQRHPRLRVDFETAFADGNGMEFWTVRRVQTASQRIGNLDAMQHVHTVRLEGIVRHKDDAVAANATEYQLQANAEAIADALRPDTTLGSLVELSWLGGTVVDDMEFAGIASHRVRLDLQAQEFVTS